MKRRERIRRRVGAVVARHLFNAIPRVASLHPVRRYPEKYGFEVFSDLEYRSGGDPSHRLDVTRWAADHRPSYADKPVLQPIVFYIHGGGFHILSKDTHAMVGFRHAKRRHVVFNVNYRLAPKHHFPAALEDVCDAWCWILDNAESYGGDPRRIVVGGESAGANLATALTIATTWRRPEPWAQRVFDRGVVPRAVVAAYGILQVDDTDRFHRERPLPWIVRDRIEAVGKGYLPPHLNPADHPLASPIVFLESEGEPDRPLPPFFAPAGTADPIVSDTRRLEAVLQKRGVPCRARYYPGETHGFHGMLWRTAAHDCWREMLDFIDHRVR